MMVKLIHLIGVFSLVAIGFYGLGNLTEHRKKWVSILTGAAGLLALLTGFHLLAVGGIAMGGWLVVKLICWLGLMALIPMAFKKREKASVFTMTCGLLVLVALVMAVLKPF